MTQADIRLSTQERQQQAVAVVTELVSELSPGEITTTDVARRMGVTQGALFRHFPSKDALWEAVMQHVRRQMLARLQQIRAEQPDPMATPWKIFRRPQNKPMLFPYSRSRSRGMGLTAS